MIANNHSSGAGAATPNPQSPLITEEIQAFCAAAVPRLETLVKSQREAASNAHSSAAEMRHNELAEALEAAVEFINKLKVARQVKEVK